MDYERPSLNYTFKIYFEEGVIKKIVHKSKKKKKNEKIKLVTNTFLFLIF